MRPSPLTTGAQRNPGKTLPQRAADFLAAYEHGHGAAATASPPHPPIDLIPALSRMRTHDAPYTFATIDSFLPSGLYQAVLGAWPPEPEFSAVTLSGAPSGYFGSRQQLTIENSAARTAVGAPAWLAIRQALRSPSFVRALFTRFSAAIEANLAALGPRARNAPCFKLYANLDTGENEALGAHVDALTKLLTIVIYLSLSGDVTDDSPTRWGTALYTAEPGAATPLQFRANAGLPVARQVQFAENRAFVMPNAAGALHGVCGGENGVTRRTLMCGYYVQQPQ